MIVKIDAGMPVRIKRRYVMDKPKKNPTTKDDAAKNSIKR